VANLLGPRGTLEVHVLQVMKYAVSAALSRDLIANKVEVLQERNYLTDQMVYAIKVHVAGEKLDTIAYPSDWWQAFKERWFPAWLQDRHPVKYTRYEVHAQYPRMAIPDQGVIRVYKADNPLKALRGAA
jgi:hypothetical protein